MNTRCVDRTHVVCVHKVRSAHTSCVQLTHRVFKRASTGRKCWLCACKEGAQVPSRALQTKRGWWVLSVVGFGSRCANGVRRYIAGPKVHTGSPKAHKNAVIFTRDVSSAPQCTLDGPVALPRSDSVAVPGFDFQNPRTRRTGEPCVRHSWAGRTQVVSVEHIMGRSDTAWVRAQRALD